MNAAVYGSLGLTLGFARLAFLNHIKLTVDEIGDSTEP